VGGATVFGARVAVIGEGYGLVDDDLEKVRGILGRLRRRLDHCETRCTYEEVEGRRLCYAGRAPAAQK